MPLDPVYGCELWDGKLDRDGYGPYRAAWEAKNGPVPPGMVLHHLCSRRRCIALPHLLLCTQSENLLYKSWRYVAKKTHCPEGHDYFRYGRRTPERGKVCAICSGVWDRR